MMMAGAWERLKEEDAEEGGPLAWSSSGLGGPAAAGGAHLGLCGPGRPSWSSLLRWCCALCLLGAALALRVLAARVHQRHAGKPLTFRGLATCALHGENCIQSACCQEPGMACYRKTDSFAMCRPQCTPGPDPVDPRSDPWDCELIGERTPGTAPASYWGGLKAADWVARNCSAPGEDCRSSRCCRDSGMTCFAKDPSWASCKATCTPGFADLADTGPEPWRCTALGNPTPGKPANGYMAKAPGPWVAEACAAPGGNCLESRCCAQPGTACFQKDDAWAGCRALCQAGPYLQDPDPSPWACNQLGPFTPGFPAVEAPPQHWVAERCTGDEGSCAATKCCSSPGRQCYKKDEGWAACLERCSPGVHADDPDPYKTPWSCRKVGPRTPGGWTHPSLFCWAISQSSGGERDLLSYQFANTLSLFQCEAWSVFSDVEFDLGKGILARPIGDLTAKMAQWGSWANTKVFVKAWHAIFEAGEYLDHDWTVKVDPDSVFFPDRLKPHLASLPVTEPWCIHNARGQVPLLGPIEVLNRAAMLLYRANNNPAISGTDKAMCEDPYMGYSGEDGFIGGCLERIGVRAQYNPAILQLSTEACGDANFVVYHPAKVVAQYSQCESEAVR